MRPQSNPTQYCKRAPKLRLYLSSPADGLDGMLLLLLLAGVEESAACSRTGCSSARAMQSKPLCLREGRGHLQPRNSFSPRTSVTCATTTHCNTAHSGGSGPVRLPG